MFPWMRDQIVEAWHNRKSSRTADRQSLTVSSTGQRNCRSGNDATMLMAANDLSENFKINIISLEGNTLCLQTKASSTIGKIKTMAMQHFYGEDPLKPASQFRLVHSSKFRQLPDESNLDEEEIEEFEELLLTEIRVAPPKENLSEDALKGPNEEDILQATLDIPQRNSTRPVPSTDCQDVDFQAEIRKILITLVQASARILNYSPSSAQFYEILREKLEARCKPPNDPKAVKELVHMGFSEKNAIKALHLRRNIADALEWLIDHEDSSGEEDVDFTSPLEETEEMAGPSSSNATGRRKSIKEACIDLFKGNQSPKKEANLVNIVSLLLESFRQYKKLEFKANPQMIESLKEMGFEDKKIVEALKVTGNHQSNACEWLVGERRRSLQDLDEGLDPDGPIYKAIMSNPHIQLSLTSPKMLLACLSMLETPTSTNAWISDPEVSPVLSQILKTYQSEKHAIHMNRFDDHS